MNMGRESIKAVSGSNPGVAHKGYNPIRPLGPSTPRPLILTVSTTTATTAAATAASAAPAECTAMASLRVLAFDHEGRPVQFDTWLDDLQLYLLSDIKDGVSLFDHVSGAAAAPPTTADSATRSQWLSRDAAARLAIRNHLPLAECAHFGQHRTAQALYDAVVARYSSPATAALGRLLLPYLFPNLSAFDTVEDLVYHIRASNARYRAAVPAECSSGGGYGGGGCVESPAPPPTPSPTAAAAAEGGGCVDHFLSLDPTSLTVDLFEQHLLAAETTAVAVAARARVAREVEVAAEVMEVAAGVVVGAIVEVVAAVGLVEGVGALVAAVEAAVGVTALAVVGLVEVGLALGVLVLEAASGIAAAALGASEFGTLPGTALAEALHTFTLDSGASRCFFCDSYTLTPLPEPVPVRLADPSRGPVVAHSSTVLPCPAVPSGSPSGLHPPSFSTNLVSIAALQDAMVTTTTPGGQRVLICTCTRMGRHLATFTRRPGSSLYTLATEPSHVAASARVSALGQVAASRSCRLLSHQTLLWHHRLGHPSLPRLRGMHSRLLVSGLPRSLPPLPPSPAPPCLPCIEGRQRTAPHSSWFPFTIAPVQTLHMDVWGPARVSGRSRKRYFLLSVSSSASGSARNFLSYVCTLIEVVSSRPTSCGTFVVGRAFSIMEVARTSMIHAATPHFLWPFAVKYAAHQLNLWPRVSLPETSPTLCWTGKVGDASVFRFYHPTLRRVFPSEDVTFDESVPFYHLFSYLSPPPLPPSLFLAPGPPPVDPLPHQGPAPSGVSQVDPLPGPAPVQVAVGSRAARGAASEGAEPGGAESEGDETGGAEPGGVATGGVESWGTEPEGVEPEGAASECAESGGAEPQGAALSGGSAGALPRLSPQQLREWFCRRARLRSGASGAGGAGAAGAGGTGVAARAGVPGVAATSGPRGARTRGTGAAGTGGVEGAGAGDLSESGTTGAGAGGSSVGGTGAGGAGVGGPGVRGAGAGGARAVDPGGAAGGLTERHEPASRPVLHVCTAHCAPRSRPPPVTDTHAMTLRPSSVSLRVSLPAPPESSLPTVPEPESDRADAASPTVSRLLATAVTDPSFESDSASALVAELLDFAAACRLDYATALVAESASASPPSVGGECALGTDVLEDRQEDFECLAAAVPRFASMLLAPEGDPDAPDIPTPRSYAEAIT
ncbi:unnamed protein product, partial [Closterium sp. NIES-54]